MTIPDAADISCHCRNRKSRHRRRVSLYHCCAAALPRAAHSSCSSAAHPLRSSRPVPRAFRRLQLSPSNLRSQIRRCCPRREPMLTSSILAGICSRSRRRLTADPSFAGDPSCTHCCSPRCPSREAQSTASIPCAAAALPRHRHRIITILPCLTGDQSPALSLWSAKERRRK